MANRPFPVETTLKIAGIISPYLAVILGVFVFKSGTFAVLLYHLILLICIISLNRKKTLKLLVSGFRPCYWPLICLGGLLPGAVIFYLWPWARQETINLAHTMDSVGLSNVSFTAFALYACFVNPFLEESFWRGCFKPKSWLPGPVDVLFAGYHAVVMFPVAKPAFVIFSFLALAFVGWIFRQFYRLTGGLAIPVLIHIVADITIVWAMWQIMQ